MNWKVASWNSKSISSDSIQTGIMVLSIGFLLVQFLLELWCSNTYFIIENWIRIIVWLVHFCSSLLVTVLFIPIYFFTLYHFYRFLSSLSQFYQFLILLTFLSISSNTLSFLILFHHFISIHQENENKRIEFAPIHLIHTYNK